DNGQSFERAVLNAAKFVPLSFGQTDKCRVSSRCRVPAQIRCFISLLYIRGSLWLRIWGVVVRTAPAGARCNIIVCINHWTTTIAVTYPPLAALLFHIQ